jgi:integrase
VTEALAAHLAAAGPSEGGLVFHTSGRPISRSSAWKLASKAGVASGVGRMVPVEGDTDQARYHGPTWHDLRHHHASVLLSRGVSPALVAERLGHDIKTLMRTYAHVIRSDADMGAIDRGRVSRRQR